MTEETKGRKQEEETKRAVGNEEEPQVYSVKKGLTGWNFSRRDFLAATATAAAAAIAAAVAATDEPNEETSATAEVLGESITLAVAMPVMRVVRPGEAFAQVWQFTNNSDTTWCRGARLHLVDGDQMQAPASTPVPDIAPGESVAVQVDLVAPAEPGTYQGSWRLQVAHNPDLGASGPFIVLNGCIAESPHPYENNMDQTWTVTNPDTNAQSTRVHFSQVDVESGYDYIILKDGTGQEYQRITGSYPSGLRSNPVPGQVVQVQLLTDFIVTEWGFCLDQVETAHVIYLPIVIKQPTPTPSPSPTPCSCHGVCSCVGDYCSCNTVHYWYPN